MLLRDFLNRPLSVGDVIVYPVRSGSSMWLSFMRISEINVRKFTVEERYDLFRKSFVNDLKSGWNLESFEHRIWVMTGDKGNDAGIEALNIAHKWLTDWKIPEYDIRTAYIKGITISKSFEYSNRTWKINKKSFKFVLSEIENGNIPKNWRNCYVLYPKKSIFYSFERCVKIDSNTLSSEQKSVLFDNEMIIANLNLLKEDDNQTR